MTWRLMVKESFVYLWKLSHEVPKGMSLERKINGKAINFTSCNLKYMNNEDEHSDILGMNVQWGEIKLPFSILKASEKKDMKKKLTYSILISLVRRLNTEPWCYQCIDFQSYWRNIFMKWKQNQCEKQMFDDLEKVHSFA